MKPNSCSWCPSLRHLGSRTGIYHPILVSASELSVSGSPSSQRGAKGTLHLAADVRVWTTKVKRHESHHCILFNYIRGKPNDLWCGMQPKSLLLVTHTMLHPKGIFSSLTQKKIQILCWEWHFLTCKWYFPVRQAQSLARGSSLFITVVDNMERIFSAGRMRITVSLAGMTLKLGVSVQGDRRQDHQEERKSGETKS